MKKSVIFSALFIVCTIIYACIFPIKSFIAKADMPTEGKAECVIEMNTGRILYEARGDLRLPLASTTKVLTAATVLEICDNLDEEIEIPAAAVGVEGSSVYLKAEEKFTVRDLLYGLMLRSGNDCAVALALHCSGSIAEFSVRMNEIAQKSGALNSHFENPHGLPSKNHYTTARDLCYITRYAFKNPFFAEIVSTKYYQPRGWVNKNKLLKEYDGAIGVKTGYTKEAGRCLVSAAKRENMALICVVLNCAQMYERSSKLMDDAFSTYRYTPLLSKGTHLPLDKIEGKVLEDYYYPLSAGEIEQLEIRTFGVKSPQSKKIVGQFGIYLSKRLLFSGNLYKL